MKFVERTGQEGGNSLGPVMKSMTRQVPWSLGAGQFRHGTPNRLWFQAGEIEHSRGVLGVNPALGRQEILKPNPPSAPNLQVLPGKLLGGSGNSPGGSQTRGGKGRGGKRGGAPTPNFIKGGGKKKGGGPPPLGGGAQKKGG
eukprot:FR736818.1.p3 GENE.FR736818.1~~FR736818.1.p3  ORF type:complete len:142 (+),score=52.18 FR736818.1:812-1237(+)